MSGQHDDRGLEARLAQRPHDFAAIGVRQPDIHDHEIGRNSLGGLSALGAGIDGGRLKLLMQRELFDQRVAEITVVVHDQNLARVRHCNPSPPVFSAM